MEYEFDHRHPPKLQVNEYQTVRLGRIRYTAGAEIPKKYLAPG